jgi:hypothetical protein
MKATPIVALFAFLLCASPGLAQLSPPLSFDVLKSLQGEWQGQDSMGHPVKATFHLTGKGSAMASEYVEPDQNEEMISMFHVDGHRLLMTHYCSAGNQPRMSATASPNGKTIAFDFVDATNLPSLAAGHMRRLVIRILSPDHHTEQWTYVENGKDNVVAADLRRAK